MASTWKLFNLMVLIGVPLITLLCWTWTISSRTDNHILYITPPQDDEVYCKSEPCVKLSEQLRSMGNLSSDPCEDFYEYACGGQGPSRMSLAHEIVNSRIKDIIAEAHEAFKYGNISDQSGGGSMQRLGRFYDVCLQREPGYEPLLRRLRKLGGFPLLAEQTGWSEEKAKSWHQILIDLHHLGLSHNHFFNLFISIDTYDFDTVLRLEEPDLEMPDMDFIESHVKSLIEIDFELDRDATVHQLALVKNFQKRIYRSYADERTNFTKITIQDLETIAPRSHWHPLIKSIFGLEPYETMIVSRRGFIEKLDTILEETDINQEMHEISGIKLEFCHLSVTKELGFDLSYQYVSRYISSSIKERAFDVVILIYRQVVKILLGVDWMDEASQLNGTKRINKASIAYPARLEPTILDEIYTAENKSIRDGDDFFNMLLGYRRAIHNFKVHNLIHPRLNHLTLTESRFTEVNGLYDWEQNVVYLLGGLFTEAHFANWWPSYMNFAITGTTYGHEVGHSLDVGRLRADRYENTRWRSVFVVSWWDKKTEENFLRKTECLVNQYDNLEIPHAESNIFKLNGTRTLSENIADNTGYLFAYKGYENWLLNNEKVVGDLLPRLNLNQRQLFWLALANKRCNYMEPNDEARAFEISHHSPDRFRVNLALSNLPQFSRDFNCPPNSPMNPASKCHLWQN